MKTIAIDLDDTLNDFSETLRTADFVHDDSHPFSAAIFQDYLERVRRDAPEPGNLLSTEYSYFRHRIHHECYLRARPRVDGIEFLRWLKAQQWRVVICTYRDLRRAYAGTTAWLREHGIPYDHLFMAGNKIVFCKTWGIGTLIDDDLFNIAHGERYGVQVYFPVAAKHAGLAPQRARGFRSFEELVPWIRK